MTLCRATPLDVTALAQLCRLQPFSARWTEQDFKAELTHSASVICCLKEGDSFIGFLAVRQAAGFAEVLNFAVHPAFARRGHGGALLSHALAELKAQAVSEVTLEVNHKNIAAVSLYTKLGFLTCGRRVRFYNNTDDALVMNKTL